MLIKGLLAIIGTLIVALLTYIGVEMRLSRQAQQRTFHATAGLRSDLSVLTLRVDLLDDQQPIRTIEDLLRAGVMIKRSNEQEP